MVAIKDFIKTFPIIEQQSLAPWILTNGLLEIISGMINTLDSDFIVSDGVAIHKTATIETGVIIKPPVIISANTFIAAHSYLRGGVYLDSSVSIGPGCEVKSSIICERSSIAHFNFIGDSVIGHGVNFEAGSIIANYHNDKIEKEIVIQFQSNTIHTGVYKFGALVGDNSKIGANAVLSPGTILPPDTIVGRLQLI